MSVSQAFAMLNESISGIRKDRQAHESRMMQLEMYKVKDDREWNSPENQLKRQQAEHMAEPITVNSGAKTRWRSVTDKETFDNVIYPAQSRVIPDGHELAPDGRIVIEGTNEDSKFPRWKAKQIQADIDMAGASAHLSFNKQDDDIQKLTNDISKTEADMKKFGKPNDIGNFKLSIKKSKLADMQREKNDPSNQVRRLMSDNVKLMRMTQLALGGEYDNPKLLNQINTMLEINNKHLKTILSTNSDAGKGLKAINLWRPSKDGTKRERKVYLSAAQANMLGSSLMMPDGMWNVGSVSANPSKGVGNFDSKDWDRINKRYTMLKGLESTVGSVVNRENTVAAIMKEKNMDKGQANQYIDSFLNSGKSGLLDVYKQEIEIMENEYKNQPNFHVNKLAKARKLKEKLNKSKETSPFTLEFD
jgi:hypothetical protein